MHKPLVESLIVCNDAYLGHSMQRDAASGVQEVGKRLSKAEPGSTLLKTSGTSHTTCPGNDTVSKKMRARYVGNHDGFSRIKKLLC